MHDQMTCHFGTIDTAPNENKEALFTLGTTSCCQEPLLKSYSSVTSMDNQNDHCELIHPHFEQGTTQGPVLDKTAPSFEKNTLNEGTQLISFAIQRVNHLTPNPNYSHVPVQRGVEERYIAHERINHQHDIYGTCNVHYKANQGDSCCERVRAWFPP